MNYDSDNVNKKITFNSDFWDEYRTLVVSRGVPEAKAEWYVKWARKFAVSMRGVPLKARTTGHVKAFLADLEKQPGIQKWRVQQAEDALSILYKEFLVKGKTEEQSGTVVDDSPGLSRESGDIHVTPIKEKRRGTTFRDSLSRSREVEEHHKEIISRLRTVIRTRHYSLDTERTYEEWVRRFIIFHNLKTPRELGPDAVREYLEYLAEVRMVAAGTQNQALLKAFSGQQSAFS